MQSACYDALADALTRMLKGSREGIEHAGGKARRRNTRERAALNGAKALLGRILKKAVAAEEYEKAAGAEG